MVHGASCRRSGSEMMVSLDLDLDRATLCYIIRLPFCPSSFYDSIQPNNAFAFGSDNTLNNYAENGDVLSAV